MDADGFPVRHLLAGLAQHPGAQGFDQAGFFGNRDEFQRRDLPTGGVGPAQQGFHAAHPAAGGLHLRLVVDIQLLVGDGVVQVALQLHALGGGGKGMYVAHDEDDLKNILDALVDLKKTNYYFEHYIERSRHIEVQIVADNYGEVIHLGERECSIQRRNQKLLEESPSIALTHEMRKQVGTLAVKAAKSVHYSNVGTVEFLLNLKDNQFYFMEINPRIQVEHGVTEEVTGIDIVRTQIRIAAGEPLDITQADVHFQGHAIECRINAEDPDNNFMPSPGQITFLHEPSGPRVRFDSGVTAGLSIEPYYDSMIAKLIVHGRTRGDAIKIMQRALKEFRIDGVKTTISLHQKILSDSYFRTGNIDTQFIKKRIATYEAQKESGKNYFA